MSRLIATILLAILMFPLAAIFYVVVFVVYGELTSWWSGEAVFGFILSGLLTWAVLAVYWWLLRRQQISWTPRRRRGTLLSMVVAVVLGAVVGGATTPIDDGFGAFVGSTTAPLLWLVGTVLVWRESPAEHAARLASLGNEGLTCPTCGYNLTGLKGTRCPECGSEFTLDQLLASQPGKAQGELEAR